MTQSESVLKRSVTQLGGEKQTAQKSTQEAYLHVIRGGFDAKLRKKVRQVFAESGTDNQKEDDDQTDYDLLVGILEEIHAVGIKSFTITHVKKIATIFELLANSSTQLLVDHGLLASALAKLRIPFDAETYHLPDSLESLVKRYCTEEKMEARRTQFETRQVPTQ